MSFFVSAFLATSLLMFFIALELKKRKQRGFLPNSLKSLWIYGQKSSAPHPRYPAFLFAALSFFFFQLWEGFLRFLLQREGPLWLNLLGLLALLSLIYLRERRLSDEASDDLRLGSYWVLGFFAAISLLLSSWGTLICLPWIYLRTRFLPARF
jgi:hypothetical protein